MGEISLYFLWKCQSDSWTLFLFFTRPKPSSERIFRGDLTASEQLMASCT